MKSSIDAHWQKLLWELGMSRHQNDSKTTESIKEAKAICIHFTQEAETLCSMTIRDTEAWGASQADSLHWSHAKSIQHLEEQAIEEENKSQLDFLSTCQPALQASPVELCGLLVASYHILMGQAPTSHPFSLSQGASSSEQVSAPVNPSPPVPEHSPRPKQHPSPDLVDVLPPVGTMSKATLEGPPSSKQWEIIPLHKALTWSHPEAFRQDSSLVRETREEYFKRHCPNFNTENTHNLSDVFQHMAKTAELLGSGIYEIKEVRPGLGKLQQANYMLRTLPKGLKFLRAVPPSTSPKVMDLTGIHDWDALCHFNGVTHCSWCRKEGQNEGTVINHLQRVHYRLGLVCKKCFGCPSTSLETLHHHSQKDCQPSGKGGPNKLSSLA